MKTYQDLIDYCANTDGLEDYVEPLVRIRKNKEALFEAGQDAEDLFIVLVESFHWMNTEEGYHYWNCLFLKLGGVDQ